MPSKQLKREERLKMSTTTEYDPRVSEFESKAQSDSYTLWLKSEIDKRSNDDAIGIPHDQVMMRMNALLSKYPVQKTA
jgi:hypothetical protein